MKSGSKLKSGALLIVTLALVSGCAAPTAVERKSQPLELVPASCNSAALPPRLTCIQGDRFERGDEFEACRLSVEIYLGALDQIYACSYEAVENQYTRLKASVQSAFDCYIKLYDGATINTNCPPVEKPEYQLFDEVEGIQANWGIPECVSPTSLLRNPENLNSLQLELCDLEVKTFLSDGKDDDEQPTFGAASADRQFNDYMINLQKRIEAEAAETITQFNCKGLAQQGCDNDIERKEVANQPPNTAASGI